MDAEVKKKVPTTVLSSQKDKSMGLKTGVATQEAALFNSNEQSMGITEFNAICGRKNQNTTKTT